MKIREFSSPGTGQMSQLGRNHWSVARLIALSKDLEVFEIPLRHLNVYHVYESLTLRDMVMHFKTVNDANLDCPIIMDEDGEVMDGRHRIMKAIMEDRETIKAVRFDVNPDPCRRDE